MADLFAPLLTRRFLAHRRLPSPAQTENRPLSLEL
jgi:hypothetical protein